MKLFSDERDGAPCAGVEASLRLAETLPLRHGDRVLLEIEGIGRLENPVEAEPDGE